MKNWILIGMLVVGTLHAEDVVQPDISALVDVVQRVDSIPPVADSSQVANQNKRPGLIKRSVLAAKAIPDSAISIYFGGGEGSPWFELGVLEGIERYQIPVSSIIGAGWGAWIGALWAEGYSTDQIWRWLIQADSLDGRLFWGNEKTETNASFLSLMREWTVQRGAPQVELRFSRQVDSVGKPNIAVGFHNQVLEGKRVVARLLLQQPLLEVGKTTPVVPWNVMYCNAVTPSFSTKNENTAVDLVMNSIGFLDIPGVLPADACGVPASKDFEKIGESKLWMLVFSVPERNSKMHSPAFLKEMNELVKDSLFPHTWVRPHMVPIDSIYSVDTWNHLGLEALRSRLGDLKNYSLKPRNWGHTGRTNGSLETVQPAFDEVSPELQNHLSSFWNSETTWQTATANFIDELNQNGLYDSVNVTLQTQRASDLEESQLLTIPVLGIRANSTPELVLAAGGWGSNLIGPHFTGSIRLRFVQQFEYDLKIQGSYGAWRKQFVPELLFSRIHGGDLAFFAGADLLRSNNMVYQTALEQYLDEPDLIVQSENRMNANLQVRWTPEPWWVLNSGVQIGQDDLTTAKTKRFRTETRKQSYAAVNTMEVFSEWKRTKSSDHYFFDENGNQWGGRIAFRSLLINNSGQSNAPLYSRAHGYAATSKTFWGMFTAGLNGSGGVDGRSGPDGWEYPDSLVVVLNQPSDPAIRNHFKMHIDATPFSSMLPIPQLSSFHFLQVGGKMGIHWNGNGFWIFGSWIHDYSAERDFGLLEDRFSLEPLIRAHFSSLEVLLGLHRTIAKKDISNILDSEGWLAILQVGLVDF